jgi:large subunit ribosomal protein L30
MADKKSNMLRVTLIKSPIGAKKNHVASVRGLGLHRMHETVELKDTPEVRGMINCVNFLVKVG